MVYALTHQEARRNLTVEQKAIIGRKTLMLNEVAKAKQRKLAISLAPKGAMVGKATEIVAKRVGVGTKSIERAATIAAEPKLEEMVYKGEISLHGASDFLKGIRVGDREAIIDQGPTAIKEETRKIRADKQRAKEEDEFDEFNKRVGERNLPFMQSSAV